MGEQICLANEKKLSSDEYRRLFRDNILRFLQDKENFELVEFVGEGSYGEVVAVNIPHYEETLALKIVLSNDTWLGEMTLWPTLDHQNLLPLLELIEVPYAHLFLTPLLYGDMETILESREFIDDPNSLGMARKWLRDVLDALDYLHSLELCHLDIKADNVLIDYDLKAVLCDFSFISRSDEPIERYGVPIPYRPPETCLALEEHILVDGTKFDMWSYGMLALNVFTNHFLKRRIHLEMKKWHRDIYPLLYEAMQITYFRHLMFTAFPASNIENEFSAAFNLVQFVLRVQPIDRPSIEDTIDHIFFNRGFKSIEKPDDIWLFQEKIECLCVQPKKILPFSKDNFEHYKYRKTFKKTGVHYKSRKRWEKPSTNIKNTEKIIESSFDFIDIPDNKSNEIHIESPEKLEELVDVESEFGASTNKAASVDKVSDFGLNSAEDESHIFKSDNANKEQVVKEAFVVNIDDPVDIRPQCGTTGHVVFKKSVVLEVNKGGNMTKTSDPIGNENMASLEDLQYECNNKAYTEKDVDISKINEEILRNAKIENHVLKEESSLKKSDFVNSTMESPSAVTLWNVSDFEKEFGKQDLLSWLKEKATTCASNIRRILVARKKMKDNESESPSPKV